MGNIKQGYNQSDLKDSSSELIKVIKNIIRSEINAPFLGKVIDINGNKVDIITLDTPLYNGVPMPTVIYYDMLVGFFSSNKLKVDIPLSIGDIGLCIVTDMDINLYAETGNGGAPKSYRRFSKMDSVFLPLSMFIQNTIDDTYKFNYNDTFNMNISGNNTISISGGKDTNSFSLDIDDDGNTTYTIVDNSITIELSKNNGIILKDSNNNNITINNSGIIITDKNNNKIEMGTSGININNGALEILK